MSLQRLYQLDRSFAKDLDNVLKDNRYVEKLQNLPSKELPELVNYLNDVCPPPCETNLANSPYRLLTVSIAQIVRPGNVSLCCRRYAELEKLSPTPTMWLEHCRFLSVLPLPMEDPATRIRVFSVARTLS
jgi:hypothetical protein